MKLTILLSLAISSVFLSPALANQRVQGNCEIGNRPVITGGINSASKFMQSFPQCTVTVYISNTGGTLASLFSTASGTPQTNPFNSDAAGHYAFYSANGLVDVQISGGGLASPITYGAIQLFDPEVLIVDVTDNQFAGGAKCDGIADDTVSIQAALNSGPPVTVKLPTGTCNITGSGLTIQNIATNLVGNGQRNSFLSFSPGGAGKIALTLKNSNAGAELGMNRLEGFTLVSGDSFQKTGVSMVDTEENIISFGCQGWNDSTASSICLQVKGRQQASIHDSNFFADIPISLDVNPRNSISVDHFKFENIYMVGVVSKPCISVVNGVALSNVEFAHNAYVTCSNVLGWTSNSMAYTSFQVTFRGGRWEQSTAADYAFKLAFTGGVGVQNFRVEDFYIGSPGANSKGFFLRNCQSCQFMNINYADPSTYVDTDTFSSTGQTHWNINRHVNSTVPSGSFPGLVYWGTIGGGITTSALSIGSFNNTDQTAAITIAATKCYDIINSSGTPVRLVCMDGSDNPQFNPQGGANAFFRANSFSFASAAGSYPASHFFSIPNGQSFAGRNAAGTDTVPLAAIGAGDKPQYDGGAKGSVFGGIIQYGTSTGPTFYFSSGSPNGSVTGKPGDICLNMAGGAGTTLYVKESGASTNTGWVGK